MSKKMLSVLTALGLVAFGLAISPAAAQTEIPEVVQIDDPLNDANFVNDGHDSRLGPVGRDHTGPADASSAGDLLKVWFSNTADKASVHIQTEAIPPTSNGVGYQVFTNPGEGPEGSNTVGCLRWIVNIPGTGQGGGSYQGAPFIKLQDRCYSTASSFDAPDGEFTVEELADGTGLTTMTFDRTASPILTEGPSITAPYVIAVSPEVGSDAAGTFMNAPTIDNTIVGTDFVLTGGEVVEPPEDDPPPDDKPEKKGCKKNKGKGKKKGCDKGKGPGGPTPPAPPPAAGCPAYVPGEKGAELETAIVTDAATEEAPLEVALSTTAGVGSGRSGQLASAVSHAFQNVQVDTDLEKAGLYFRVESLELWDYDVYMDRADGTEVAISGGYMVVQDSNEADSHTEPGAETILGVSTADCAGYTVEVVGATTSGGDVTVKMWLGEATYEPPAE